MYNIIHNKSRICINSSQVTRLNLPGRLSIIAYAYYYYMNIFIFLLCVSYSASSCFFVSCLALHVLYIWYTKQVPRRSSMSAKKPFQTQLYSLAWTCDDRRIVTINSFPNPNAPLVGKILLLIDNAFHFMIFYLYYR